MTKKKAKGPKLQESVIPSRLAKFSLSAIDGRHRGVTFFAGYEDTLVTAEEKAAYYENQLLNHGRDHSREAKACRDKAKKLRYQARKLTEDEAKPLISKALELEEFGCELEDPDREEVLNAQKVPGMDHVLEVRRLPDGKDAVNEQGRPNLQSIPNTASTSDELSDVKKKALFWRNIGSWNTVEQMAFYFCGPTKPEDWEDAMFVRAQSDPFALNIMAGRVGNSFSKLLELVNMGNSDAAEAAVTMLEDLVRTLNLYAKSNPEPFRRSARKMTHWPVMLSNHPDLAEDFKHLAAQVELGQDYPFRLDSLAKWDPRDYACKLAIELYRYVESVRLHADANKHMPFAEKAKQLPDSTSNGAAGKWWNVAMAAFLHSYPHPECDKRLNALVEGEANRKFPSQIKGAILKTIKRRFLSLFPKDSR